MIEVHILIPVSDNDSKKFAPVVDQLFEEELDRLFGGSSLLPALVAGRWVADDFVYSDQNRVYAVFVSGLLIGGSKVLEAAEIAKELYAQLAITARYLGHAEVL